MFYINNVKVKNHIYLFNSWLHYILTYLFYLLFTLIVLIVSLYIDIIHN